MTAGEVYRRVSKQTTTATRELAEVRHKLVYPVTGPIRRCTR
jgi:hypothetical protein